jgi:hypothetical protein
VMKRASHASMTARRPRRSIAPSSRLPRPADCRPSRLPRLGADGAGPSLMSAASTSRPVAAARYPVRSPHSGVSRPSQDSRPIPRMQSYKNP